MRGLRSHFREEGHDVERVTVQSDVVMQTDQRKTTIATARARITWLKRCTISLTPMQSKSWQRNILATRRRRRPRTKLLPSTEELASHRRVRVQRFQDGRGEALQRGGELEQHERGLIAGREDAILRDVHTFVRGTGATCISGAQHRMRGLRE